MKNMKLLILVLMVMFSCSQDNVVSEFAPNGFFIKGKVDGVVLRYPQVNFEWTNVSNKYFTESQETWLQAYADTSNLGSAYWTLRIHDVDIRSLNLPYTLKNDEGSINWFDERVDKLIGSTESCQGVDAGCTFALTSGKNRITLTNVSEDVIEGTFHGKAIITGTGFAIYENESLNHTITNGKFKIKYRTD